MTRVCCTERTPEPSGTARRKTSNTDSCRWYRERLAAENPHLEELGGGGGGGGLDLIDYYLDKIRSFWFVFRLIWANRMSPTLKIGDMLFCCNTDVIQTFVSFNFYDLLLNANWEKIFSLCFRMADYSILHERVCYLLYKKFELWVYVSHQILQQSTCHNHVLNYMSVQNLAQT